MSMPAFRMATVAQQVRSNWLPNRRIPSGRGEKGPLGPQVGEHGQVVVFAPVHFVGSHPKHVIKKPRMRRLHRAQEQPPFPRVAFAEDLAGSLDRHLTHLGHCEDLKLLGEVGATPLPGRGHTVYVAVVPTKAVRQGICVATRARWNISCQPLRLRLARQLSAILSIQMFGKFGASARGESLGF